MKTENKKYYTEQLVTYLGNKRLLINDIENEVLKIQKELNNNKTVNWDVFSGSGIVARMLKQHSSTLIVNDLEDYSHIINKCYLTNKDTVDWKAYEYHHSQLSELLKNKDNYISNGIIYNNYAPKDSNNIKLGERVFYTSENAKIIDTINHYLENVSPDITPLFLGPLLSEASIKTNTAGVFKGFYKNSETGKGQYGGNAENALQRIKAPILLQKPILSNFFTENIILQGDSNILVDEVKNVDIAYIDPPYNQHPYGSNYFLLNIITRNKIKNEISKVSGIEKGWNRSLYNKEKFAKKQLETLIRKLDAKYIIISYSSDGFIKKEEMENILEEYKIVSIKEIKYNTYRASRNLENREKYVTEYLYTVKKENIR